MSDVTIPSLAPVRPTRAERAEQIRLYAADGLSAMAIARLIGVWVQTVKKIAADYGIALPSHAEACRASWQRPDTIAVRRAASIKAAETRKAMMAARVSRAASSTPDWVPNDLREDWRDFSRLYGATVATRELRAMILEMEMSS